MHIAPAILAVALLVSLPLALHCSKRLYVAGRQNHEAAQELISPAAKDQFAAGERAFEGRDYRGAQEHFERVTQLAPSWARGWKALGVTLALQNNVEAAEPPLRKACELSPTEPDACYYLARGFYARDKFTAALKILQPLLVTDPEPARIEEGIAQAKEGLGDFDDAERWYRRAVEHDPRRRALGLGRSLMRQGRFREGLPWLKRAVQYEPDSGQAHFALGRAYLEASSPNQAISELEQAVRLQPQDDAARRLLQKARSQRAADRR